jgi:transcriptional regulator with XRE-family HTH domain
MELTTPIIPLAKRQDIRSDTWSADTRTRMRPWGITITELAMNLGVSRQYVWQVLYGKIPVSEAKKIEISTSIERMVFDRQWGASFGQRLRGARIGAGMTLRQVAGVIGYSWVAVERWEKDVCLPKPGVLWHLRHIYGVGEDWLPGDSIAAVSAHQANG